MKSRIHSHRPQGAVTPALVLLILALSVPVVAALLASTSKKEVVFTNAQHMEQLGGDFGWYFFERRLLGPTGGTTNLQWSIQDNMHTDWQTSKRLAAIVDITNPTLFHLFVGLLILSGLWKLLSRRPTPAS